VKENALSIVARAPVIAQAANTYAEMLQTEKEQYVISDSIGFDSGSFTLTGPTDYLHEWYENGLVRDVVWKDPDGGICWEGYVNRLQLVIGDRTLTKSVENMANRVILNYTPLDTTKNPPTAGAKTPLTKNDTASQARYGIKSVVSSGAECTTATADDRALAELAWYKIIPSSEVVTIGKGKQPSLKVDCKGYAYMANWYVYSQTVSSSTANASAIVSAVLAADPNSVMSTSTLNIDTNATATEQFWSGDELGWKIIQELAMRGLETGSVGYRWHCGVYAHRRTTFKAAEGMNDNKVPYSTNKHQILHRQIRDASDAFIDEAGREWMPWELRPDRLIYTEGVPGRPTYITSVKVSMPWKVHYEGTDQVNPMALLIRDVCARK
jgi:hypothetical protein